LSDLVAFFFAIFKDSSFEPEASGYSLHLFGWRLIFAERIFFISSTFTTKQSKYE